MIKIVIEHCTENFKKDCRIIHDYIRNEREQRTQDMLTEVFKSYSWLLFFQFFYNREDVEENPHKYPALIDMSMLKRSVFWGANSQELCAFVANQPFQVQIHVDSETHTEFLGLYYKVILKV
jgi:hypothetical protein